MKRFYAVLNLVVIIAVIVANYLTTTQGFTENTVGGISDKYDTLFAPAGYAFSIWGLIYLGLLTFGVFQIKKAFFNTRDNDFILSIGPWLSIANLANIFWLWAWLSENLFLSVILMGVILFSLLIIILRLEMNLAPAPFPIVAWVWWPVSIYAGWISVATIANFSAYMVQIEWQSTISAQNWTIIMILVAGALNVFLVIRRRLREFAAIGVWALIAIAVKHQGGNDSLFLVALIVAIVISTVIVINAYLNRKSGTIARFRNQVRETHIS